MGVFRVVRVAVRCRHVGRSCFFSQCVPCPWPARTGSSPVASGPGPGNICAGTLSSTNSGGGLTQSGSFLGDSGCCDPCLKSHSSLRDQGPVDSGKEPVYRSPRPTVPTVAVQEWTHPSRFHPARHHLAAEDLPTSVCFLEVPANRFAAATLALWVRHTATKLLASTPSQNLHF